MSGSSHGGLVRSASPQLEFFTIDPPSSPSRQADKDGWESVHGIILEVRTRVGRVGRLIL